MLRPEKTWVCLFFLLKIVWPLSLWTFLSRSKPWSKWETKDLVICLCDSPHPWANWPIHPWIDPQLEVDPISKLYRKNNTWCSFGFNCFLVSSPLTLLGKHCRSYPFSSYLFFCRNIPKGCGVVFYFLELPTQVCVAFRAILRQAYKALDWLCGAIPLILNSWVRCANCYTMMVSILRSCSLRKWHLSASFHINFFTLLTN